MSVLQKSKNLENTGAEKLIGEKLISEKSTKQRLIETAREMIWKSSYSSVSVDDICKKADAKKGSFYHYFTSKADLAVATIEFCYSEAKPKFEEIFSGKIAPKERISKLCEHIIEKQSETKENFGKVCGCPFASLASELAGEEKIIEEKMIKIKESHFEYYRNLIRDLKKEKLISKNLEEETLVVEIHSYILGMMTNARIENSVNCLQVGLEKGILNLLQIKN